MNKVFFILISVLFFSCKKDSKPVLENESIANTEAIEVAKPQDTIVYFENALIYQYEQNEVKEELWLYVNEKEKQILYVPNDDKQSYPSVYQNYWLKRFERPLNVPTK